MCKNVDAEKYYVITFNMPDEPKKYMCQEEFRSEAKFYQCPSKSMKCCIWSEEDLDAIHNITKEYSFWVISEEYAGNFDKDRVIDMSLHSKINELENVSMKNIRKIHNDRNTDKS